MFVRSAFRAAAALSGLLVAACTTSSDSEDLGVAAGFVYDGTPHAATVYGLCDNNLNYVAYWGLRYANSSGDSVSGRWLGVSVSATNVSAASWSVGDNLSTNEAEAQAGKASVLLFGVGGSKATPGARVRVTPFAGGDSVRVEGRDIVLQNGKVVNFNLVNATGCKA
jgi:hypothetical protein